MNTYNNLRVKDVYLDDNEYYDEGYYYYIYYGSVFRQNKTNSYVVRVSENTNKYKKIMSMKHKE